jgi:glucose-6-phosphate isomerase
LNEIVFSGKYKSKVKKSLEKLDKQNIVKRIWDKDSSVWKEGIEFEELIKNRLGWLLLPVSMKGNCDEINKFTEKVRSEGFKSAVVMGMGGSSMCPEVCRDIFGIKKGYLELFVLDSTDPETITKLEESIDIEKTLFIVSSKSGGTIEVDSFYRYFFDKVSRIVGADAGKQFVAITDPATSLESTAIENNFRKIFINPADIGGRYSALSYFGLVPAALIGVHIKKFLSFAEVVMNKCMNFESNQNPGVITGISVGVPGRKKKNKLTFVFPYSFNSFGYWVEQLIAESTGKEEKGILPIEGEGIGKLSTYGKDRHFVFITEGKVSKDEIRVIDSLVNAKIPVIHINIKNQYDLAGLFYFWEFATAVMGVVLCINPFDEPNVKESKDNTGVVLNYFEKNGRLPSEESRIKINDLSFFFEEDILFENLQRSNKKNEDNKISFMEMFLNLCRNGDYVALMAYIEKSKKTEKMLQKIRELIRSKKKVATTIGYGPRFLHSTGQFHKGGPDNGIFIQIVSEDAEDLQIPGKPYSFGVLKRAQAIGDYESLIKHNKRVLKVNIGRDVEKGLKELYELIKKSI